MKLFNPSFQYILRFLTPPLKRGGWNYELVTTFYPQPIFYPANYLSTFSKFPAPGKNSAAFVKKMSDFAIKRNHNVKEGLKLLVTLVYLNQNYINHDYVCSTTQLKFYAPPSFWMFFTLPSLANFRKVVTPAKVGKYELCTHFNQLWLCPFLKCFYYR